ncbi:MAG: hypothetical protein CME88_13840, partial [Hirschia sp.]|nr:hypothetical protein [Hirschia sp.]
MRKKKTHIYALIGGTLWGNRGAEAMTVAAIARMRDRDPQAHFNHFSYYPKEDAALAAKADHVSVVNGGPAALVFLIFPFAFLNGLLRLIGLGWPGFLMPGPARKLKECDALLDVQGISFDDGRVIFLPYKILSVLPAWMMGVPIFKLSQAMGPFKQASSRWAGKMFLPMCKRVFPRGKATKAALDRVGLTGDKYPFAPDVAFSFVPGDCLDQENFDHVEALCSRMDSARDNGQMVAALAPSTVVLGKMDKMGLDYVQLLVDFVADLNRRGAMTLVFPNANRRTQSKPRNNDFYVMDLLAQALEKNGISTDNVVFVEKDINFDGILKLVEHSDILLSSRFHGMVAGLSKEIPTMVVGWSHKYAEILSLFAAEDMATDYAKAVSDAPEVLNQLIARKESLKASIKANLPRVRAESNWQFDLAAKDLGLEPLADLSVKPDPEAGDAPKSDTDRGVVAAPHATQASAPSASQSGIDMKSGTTQTGATGELAVAERPKTASAPAKPSTGPTEETVLSVKHYTDRLFSFRLTRPAGFRFRSGEFVMIGLPKENGKPLLRAYSIASPSWDEELEFYSIKVPDGPLTSRLAQIQ